MCFSQLADVSTTTKRTLVEADEAEQNPNAQPTETMEPPKKKVRFCGVDTNESVDDEAAEDDTSSERTPMAPRELEKLMQKVHRRAERRKRRALRSPPPPSPPSEEPKSSGDKKSSSSCNSKELDLGSMQRKLQRMERAIKQSAKMELQLMNQSKKLREERAGLTRKYESMAAQLREMQQAQHYNEGQLFQMGSLPPLMAQPRRVSANQDQVFMAR